VHYRCCTPEINQHGTTRKKGKKKITKKRGKGEEYLLIPLQLSFIVERIATRKGEEGEKIKKERKEGRGVVLFLLCLETGKPRVEEKGEGAEKEKKKRK